MKLRLILSAILFAVAASLGSVSAAQAGVEQDLTSASVITQIEKQGVLRVGNSTFVPWVMRSKEGKLIGFEIDVAEKVAADMGVKVEFVPTQWAGIIPALLAHKFDVIISSMSITPSRNLTVNFTIPYSHSGQQMAANKKLANGFTVEQFNDPKVTIACRRGATSCKAAEELFPKATLRQFDDDAQAFQEVVNGNAYAVVSSGPKPTFWTMQHPDQLFMPTDKNLTRGDEAFAVRKGDPDAINFFNNWILVNTSNGWLQKRHDYWFKTQDWAKDVNEKQ